MLLKKIFASEGPVANVVRQTALDIVLFEVMCLADNVRAKDAFCSWCGKDGEHAYPFDIAMAMHAGFVPLPAIDIFERLATHSAVILVSSIGPVVAGLLR
jgi:hypothetical protein